MRTKFVVPTVLVLLLAGLAALGALTSSARADVTACIPGFALTSGGVIETDYNGDGLTCELTTSTSTLDTTLAVDNGPAGDPNGCPDSFTPLGWPVGTPPDRNMNGVVCDKFVGSKNKQAKPHEVVIDDHLIKKKKK